MGTRALIGIIETDAAGNQILTSTYNHYDGYPSNLGVGLNKHYDELESAKKIANMGYISFLNPETGEVEANNKENPSKDVLPDDFEEAMREVHSIADSMGADYVYLFDFDDMNWIDSKNYSTKNLVTSFEGTGIENQFEGFATFDGRPDPGEGDEMEIEEGSMSVVDKAKEALQGKENFQAYIKSLTNDVKLNGQEAYADYTVDDWEEDYISNGFGSYSDKEMNEAFIRQMKYRAGIIK